MKKIKKLSETPDDDMLLEYLQNLNSSKELEEKILNDEFAKEAAEGLSAIDAGKRLLLKNDLNTSLKKLTNTRNKRKEKFTIQPVYYIAVFLILLLVIVSYVVIKKFYR